MTLNCDQAKPELVHYLYGEVPEGCRPELEQHLTHCQTCSSELRALRATLGALDAWEPEPLPASLATPTRIPRARAWEAWLRNQPPLVEWIGAGTCGILCAVGATYLLRPYLALANLPDFAHVVLGILSGGLFTGLFHLAFRADGPAAEGRISWGRTARLVLMAVILACFAVYIIRVPAVRNFIAPVFASLRGPLRLLATYFLAGAGYAAIAFIPAALLFGRRLTAGRAAHAVAAACLYVVVMAPGLAIVCIPVGLAAYAGMLAGSAAGGVASASAVLWALSKL